VTDPHPIMAIMLAASSFVGQAAEVEDEILPLPEQFAFGPGDAGLMASANIPLEHDFAVLRGIDPEKHVETFPDWEERVLKSFVLCEHFSRDDPEISIGWFSRLKVMPISTYRYRQARKWLKDGFPEEIPAWAHQYYLKYTDGLAAHAPDRVPKVVVCPNCSSREVELRVSRRIVYSGRVGTLHKEGTELYVPVSEPTVEDTHYAQLHCTDCNSTADLEDPEWELPGISS